MLLTFDFSSTFHKTLNSVASSTGENEIGKLRPYLAVAIINELANWLSLYDNYDHKVICLDDKSGATYWRRDVYPMYKATRKVIRDNSKKFDFKEVYAFYNELIDNLKCNLGLHFLEVPRCEADDIILTLGEQALETGEEMMILSPDKDFIQLQRKPNIKQYSWLTNKWITADDKNGLENWLIEHICLGDTTDNVPRVVDFKEFNDGVKEYLIEKGYDKNITPLEFSKQYYNIEEFKDFGGPFKKPRFGVKTLEDKLNNGLENFLSDPHIKYNFERNKILVTSEGIPQEYKDKILNQYNECIKQKSKCKIFNIADHFHFDVGLIHPYFINETYKNEIFNFNEF